ncbi:glycosyltransferase family 2 protein [Alicyclobacillus herbarius]|uniref:glycosyltransferase family 2 protein n=1 Tax=Alicyclobacillus herbarius TaxID=122960 RepID=UPI000400FC35|nr:glycosyltransferase [Alicyclobacillus herbarius]
MNIPLQPTTPLASDIGPNTPPSPSVSIVVPSYRRPRDLMRCLVGIGAMDEWPEEVVVVFLDDDAEPLPDWLHRLRAWFARDLAIAGVGGRDILMGPSHAAERQLPPVKRVGRVTWYGRCIGNHHRGTLGPVDVDVLKGCNMAYRRELVWFDSHLRGHGAQVHNEFVLGLWLRDQGYRLVYDPHLVVRHYVAERFDEDGRVVRTPTAIANEAFNQLYALAVRPCRVRAWLGVGYALSVGSRAAPGILRGLVAVLRGERQTIRALWPSLRGKLAAVPCLWGGAWYVRK